MTERKWMDIQVSFDDNTSVYIQRKDFDKIKEIEPVLEALRQAQRMKWELDRLLGEAEG